MFAGLASIYTTISLYRYCTGISKQAKLTWLKKKFVLSKNNLRNKKLAIFHSSNCCFYLKIILLL